MADATHFATPEALRSWLEAHHDTETELWVLLPKKGSGEPGLTWPELVDEVLCFGWIDGHMKPIDDTWRRQRITPRRAGSKWSKRNLERVRVLTEETRLGALWAAPGGEADGPDPVITVTHEDGRSWQVRVQRRLTGAQRPESCGKAAIEVHELVGEVVDGPGLPAH